MNDSGKTIAATLVSPIISGVIVAAVAMTMSNKSESNRQLAETVSQIQIAQANIIYRIEQLEPVKDRTRNNSELIRRLCDRSEMACNIQNAIFRPLNGQRPPKPRPEPNWQRSAIAHDKRRVIGAT